MRVEVSESARVGRDTRQAPGTHKGDASQMALPFEDDPRVARPEAAGLPRIEKEDLQRIIMGCLQEGALEDRREDASSVKRLIDGLAGSAVSTRKGKP